MRATKFSGSEVILTLAGATSLTFQFGLCVGIAFGCALFVLAPYFKVINFNHEIK